MEELIPQQLDLEVSAQCNLRCKLCPILHEGAPTGLMDFEFWKSIVERVAQDPRLANMSIVNWLNGEPLLHPHYGEMCEILNSLGLRYYVTTNGTLWNQRVFEALTARGSTCYQIIFSLDGLPVPESRSIEIARPGSTREKVLRTLGEFISLARKNEAKLDIAVKAVQRGQDWEEIEKYIAHFLLMPGISYVCIGKPLAALNEESMRVYPCQYSDNKFMVVRYDGTLVRCAYNHRAHNLAEGSFGILDRETPLVEAYNNPAYQAFRAEQRGGVFSGPCAECGFAYTGSGYRGEVRFEHGELAGRTVYFREDYYNKFYSLTPPRRKPESYYAPTERTQA